MLKTLTIPEDALRKALAEDQDYDFADYIAGELGDNFDYMLVETVRVLNDVLEAHPHNAHLGGERTNYNGIATPSRESIDVTLVADTTPIIDGYEFSYDIWGARKLTLATAFSEWKHIRTEKNGIDGAVEVAEYVLAEINYTIRCADEFIAAL